MKDLSEQYFDLTAMYEKQQHHLVKEVVQVAGEFRSLRMVKLTNAATYAPILELLDNALAALDVIVR